MLEIAAEAADAMGAADPVALDVSERFPFADAFLIVTGEVERNVQAIADRIEKEMNLGGHRTNRREGREGGRWILLDFGELLVHVFHAEERDFYEIERLWRDCPTLDLPTPSVGLPERA
ncbi:ribosome silencing factor [Leucobacter sp. UCMA 4100]|nr:MULTISPECIES: ribosome silencing factor [Leucobacter]MDA3148161.1 ribosome silencing factor [Leucobacter sp. UCMA 4100]